MPSVLQLSRRLDCQPEIASIDGITIRTYQSDADIAPWLELRHQAFARQRIGVRQWSPPDFFAEFVNCWWWSPQHMWLAETLGHSVPGTDSTPNQRQLIGAVTLSLRGTPDQSQAARPAVHWLVVHPRWRRRGIGKLLMMHLEAAAWNAGHREIFLETHAAWEDAVQFYQTLGYRPVQS